LADRPEDMVPDDVTGACEALEALNPKVKTAIKEFGDPMSLPLSLVLPVLMEKTLEDMRLEEADTALLRLKLAVVVP